MAPWAVKNQNVQQYSKFKKKMQNSINLRVFSERCSSAEGGVRVHRDFSEGYSSVARNGGGSAGAPRADRGGGQLLGGVGGISAEVDGGNSGGEVEGVNSGEVFNL